MQESALRNGGSNDFWAKHLQDVNFNQLEKFWNSFPPERRQELLKIDKSTLFEQARKNFFCSRCYGFMREGFSQFVGCERSVKKGGADCHHPNKGCRNEILHPSLHLWGGLTATRDGALTFVDCAMPLIELQQVFDSARKREREGELLYPDACGGGGRGWIGQAAVGSGRGHGTREACSLYTARLSVDTLVQFWSALREDNRRHVVTMKEDDFMERLLFRFERGRFCRDCRRNVIHEFKQLKELKRTRKQPCCTSWFCVADTAFHCKVSHDSVEIDWHQSFAEDVGRYKYFEWAVGTGEGKCDILDYKNVGSSRRDRANGLKLDALRKCYINLRGWKTDGRCTKLSVQAHAVNGVGCIHDTIVVSDGFVTINEGEGIEYLFEHAEEVEEEEDAAAAEKDENGVNRESSRPQRHAQTPQLAREFFVDAATVIFKEQYLKKLLRLVGDPRRVLKDERELGRLGIIWRFLRHYTNIRIPFIDFRGILKEMNMDDFHHFLFLLHYTNIKILSVYENLKNLTAKKGKDLTTLSEFGVMPISGVDGSIVKIEKACKEGSARQNAWSNFVCLGMKLLEERLLAACRETVTLEKQIKLIQEEEEEKRNEEERKERRRRKEKEKKLKRKGNRRDQVMDQVKESSEQNETPVTRDASSPQMACSPADSPPEEISDINGSGPADQVSDSCDSHACFSDQKDDYRANVEKHACLTSVGRGTTAVGKLTSDMSTKPSHRIKKFNQVNYRGQNYGKSNNKVKSGPNSYNRDLHQTKKVWEPVESQKKKNSVTDITLQSSRIAAEGNGPDSVKASDDICGKDMGKLRETSSNKADISSQKSSSPGTNRDCNNGFHVKGKENRNPKDSLDVEDGLRPTTALLEGNPSVKAWSSSDNGSPFRSGEEKNLTSSNPPTSESLSLSHPEDGRPSLDGRATSVCMQSNSDEYCETTVGNKQIIEEEGKGFGSMTTSSGDLPNGAKGSIAPASLQSMAYYNLENRRPNVRVDSQQQSRLPPPWQNQNLPFPRFEAPSTMGRYYEVPVVSWPTSPANGLVPSGHPGDYSLGRPFGYNYTLGNSHFGPYDSVQHHNNCSLPDPGEVPMYQPVGYCGLNLMDQTKILKPNGACESLNMTRVETPQQGNPGFSLFHYSVPSVGKRWESFPPDDDGIVGDISLGLPENNIQRALGCLKADTIEEYNLFATNKGTSFSIFQ